MPNKIKYNPILNLPDGSIKVNSFDLGIHTDGTTAYGPTSSTGFWNGISPPIDGYTIYLNKGTQGPSIYVVNDSVSAQIIANMFGANNTPFNLWFFGQSDKVCLNITYPDIPTSFLLLLYDAYFLPSYPGSEGGNTIKNLALPSNNGILTNISYNEQKCLDFGINASISFSNKSPFNFKGSLSVSTLIRFSSNNVVTDEPIVEFSNTSGDTIFFGRVGNSKDLKVESFSNGSKLGEVIYPNAIVDDQFVLYSFILRDGLSSTILVNSLSYSEEISLTVKNVNFDEPYIGKSTRNNSYFGGSFSNIMIYNKILTDYELGKIYSAYFNRYS